MAPRCDLLPVRALWVSGWPDARGDRGTAGRGRMTAGRMHGGTGHAVRYTPLLSRRSSHTTQLWSGLLRTEDHLIVDGDVGTAPGMHPAEEAQVLVALL